MSLVTKEEADNHPVGEAWDEPNENPRLEKPTEGRGLFAFLSGGFFSGFAFPNFGLFFLMTALLMLAGALVGLAGIVLMAKFM